jgi:subtilisin family serine protease
VAGNLEVNVNNVGNAAKVNRHGRRRSRFAVAGVAVVAAVLLSGIVTPVDAAPPVLRDVIVRFVPGSDARAEAALLSAQGGQVSHVYEHVFAGVAASLPDAAVAALARNPRVEAVDADGVATTQGTQTSPPWGLDRTDQRSLPLSKGYTWQSDGAGVSAYIVDTGIRPDHVDFGGRVRWGATAISDGVGTNDCNGHGTHVAGTVAGASYGIAKAATLVPVRVLDCNGSGTWSGVIAGLDWIVKDHTTGPAVANMSLGGGANSSVDAAVRSVVADGVAVAVAAGNSNANACNYSPAREPQAITVGATTSSDSRASYSNIGTCLDLFAPGSGVLSAYHTSSTATATLNGTSMASPHVAGVAAVLLALNPSLTAAALAEAINTAATTDVVGSAGRGSPNRLLYSEPSAPTTPVVEPTPEPEPEPEPAPEPETATVPGAPSDVAALSGGKTSASLSWVQGSDGGKPLTGQTVVVFQGSKQVATHPVSATATGTVITGLKSNTKYSFRVSATNELGTGPLSAASNIITTSR